MRSLLLSRNTAVWAALLVATVVSLATSRSDAISKTESASIVLIIAFAKVLGVVFEFMEIRRAPWIARIAAMGWATAVCTGLLVLYGSTSSIAQGTQ